MKEKVRWSNEILQFMIDNYEGKDNIELAQMINAKFGLNVTNDMVSSAKGNLKRRRGIDLRTQINRGKYRKGVPPANKGKTWDEYMSKESQEKSRMTCFKKGCVSVNHREVGSERVNVDGYWEIKVKEPDKWELKHRYLYKQNKGDIPDGHKIIFADGDRNNLSLDNLVMVSSSEELIMNRNNLRFNNQELTKTGSIIAKVIDKTNKVRNERL